MNKCIVFLLPSLAVGGAERIIVNVANALAAETTVYLAVIRKRGQLLDQLHPGVTVIDLKGQFIWLWTLIRLLHKVKPSVMLSTFWDVNFLLCIMKSFFPGNCSLCLREPVYPGATIRYTRWGRLAAVYYRYLYRRANTSIVLNEEMRADLHQYIQDDTTTISVINNAVDYAASAKTRSTKQTPFRIITCGRLVSQKGYDQLLPAFARLCRDKPDCELVILGEGPDKQQLQQLASRSGIADKVTWGGQVADPCQYYLDADLYVLSSRYEGMPNAMLEALACGLPVVATAHLTGARDIIKEHINGITVKDCDEDDLYAGLKQAIDMYSDFEHHSISEDIRQRFSSDSMIAAYRHLLLDEM